MVLSVHLPRSVDVAFVNCPVRGQLIGFRSLKQVVLQSIWLFQETLLRAECPYHVWAIDFQFDQTMDGRRLKLLNSVDEYSRMCLAIRVG
jgi:hypothetical protein